MIRVSRNKADAQGRPIRPNGQWEQQAERATLDVVAQQSPHRFERRIYAHAEVKRALEALFSRKCAYCEANLVRSEWDVEHFRPKGRVAEREDHPGYYWLAYTWENLVPSCKFCNQHRKAQPTWEGDPGMEGGKADRFPLASELTRAMERGQEGREQRLLIDPCRDYPETHFNYNAFGEIEASKGSRKGKTSIEVFNLSEPRLRDLRRERVDELVKLAHLRKRLAERNCNEEVQLIDEMITSFSTEHKDFCGLARYFQRNPEVFGAN